MVYVRNRFTRSLNLGTCLCRTVQTIVSSKLNNDMKGQNSAQSGKREPERTTVKIYFESHSFIKKVV